MFENINELWSLLTHVCNRAKIPLSEVVSEYTMDKRKQILMQHPFAITRYSDGRWKTYILDETKRGGRRQIARSSKEEVENEVYKHYVGLNNSP